MTNNKTDAQMFLEEQLRDPEVAEAFYEGLDELRIAVQGEMLKKSLNI